MDARMVLGVINNDGVVPGVINKTFMLLVCMDWRYHLIGAMTLQRKN